MSEGTAGCNELQQPAPDDIAAWERRPLHPDDDLSIIDAFPEDQADLRELQATYKLTALYQCAAALGLADDFVARTGGVCFGPGYTTQGVYEKTEYYYRRRMCLARKEFEQCGADDAPVCAVCLARTVLEQSEFELRNAIRDSGIGGAGDVLDRFPAVAVAFEALLPTWQAHSPRVQMALTLLASLAADRK